MKSIDNIFTVALAGFTPRQLYPGHPDWESYQLELHRRVSPIIEGVIIAMGKGNKRAGTNG